MPLLTYYTRRKYSRRSRARWYHIDMAHPEWCVFARKCRVWSPMIRMNFDCTGIADKTTVPTTDSTITHQPSHHTTETQEDSFHCSPVMMSCILTLKQNQKRKECQRHHEALTYCLNARTCLQVLFEDVNRIFGFWVHDIQCRCTVSIPGIVFGTLRVGYLGTEWS